LKKKKQAHPPQVLTAIDAFVESAKETLGRIDVDATRLEELMPRSDTHFLGGNILPMLAHNLLRLAREQTLDAISSIRKGEPSDVVDEVDFYASTVAELVGMIRLLSAVELGEQPDLATEWETVAESLLGRAQQLQEACEALEDELEAAEPEEPAGSGGLVQIQ
jgi:hypothetical protein